MLTEAFDDVEKLVQVRVSREQRLASQHFRQQASDRPDIYGPAKRMKTEHRTRVEKKKFPIAFFN